MALARRQYTALEDAQQFFSDFYKSMHGIRPRFATEEQWNSITWLDQQIADLRAEQPRIEAEEAAAEAEAIKAFEALIGKTITAGAKDRSTAVRWLRDASEDPFYKHDDGYFEYTHRLPYGYLARSAS